MLTELNVECFGLLIFFELNLLIGPAIHAVYSIDLRKTIVGFSLSSVRSQIRQLVSDNFHC